MIVEHIVLGIGNHALRLDALHGRLHERVAEKGILAREILEIATVARNARDIDARTELNISALAEELLARADRRTRATRELKMESGTSILR